MILYDVLQVVLSVDVSRETDADAQAVIPHLPQQWYSIKSLLPTTNTTAPLPILGWFGAPRKRSLQVDSATLGEVSLVVVQVTVVVFHVQLHASQQYVTSQFAADLLQRL